MHQHAWRAVQVSGLIFVTFSNRNVPISIAKVYIPCRNDGGQLSTKMGDISMSRVSLVYKNLKNVEQSQEHMNRPNTYVKITHTTPKMSSRSNSLNRPFNHSFEDCNRFNPSSFFYFSTQNLAVDFYFCDWQVVLSDCVSSLMSTLCTVLSK